MECVNESFVDVRGVPTQLLKCGDIDQRNTLILVIPGNPGVPRFYQKFITSLHTGSGNFPVWVMSHAGHVTPPTCLQRKSALRTYTLEEQVQHKRAFIEEFVPQSCRLLLIGHSVGCYLIMRLLANQKHTKISTIIDVDNNNNGEQSHTNNRRRSSTVRNACIISGRTILRALCLFPTIERLSTSPNGRYATPLFHHARWLLSGVAWLASYVPEQWRLAAIKWQLSDAPSAVIPSASIIVDRSCMTNLINLAHDEMCEIKTADHETIASNWETLGFYYGTTDGWCPVRYHDDMIARHPKADIRLCKHEIEHAFVLKSSVQMAEVVSTWIGDDLRSRRCSMSSARMFG